MPSGAPLTGADEEAPPHARDRQSMTEESTFLQIRQTVDRGACDRWLKTQVLNSNDANAISAAKKLWQTTPFLLDPLLQKLAVRTLEESRGRRIELTEKFPATLWMGGATDTYDGRTFSGSFSQFVKLLQERAQKLAAKKTGWVIEPTTNRDGHRTNASTISMHALFLDCDGAGSWDQLLEQLRAFDYAYVAYQSGGWSPTAPKWRVVLPLAAPFSTQTEEQIAAWKMVYNHARVILGAAGALLGEGFDATVETPCCPWFLTERRSENDPMREITWRAGHSLDLVSMAIALPAVVEEVASTNTQTAKAIVLDDKRFEEIIAALCVPMSKIIEGRRDLYMALSGVLCARGVGEDAVQIIDEVSRRCPGLQDRRGEHVHIANTTVGCWRDGRPHTQIGTLNNWPEVAQVIDRVLPNALDEAIRLLITGDTLTPPPPPPPPPSTHAQAQTQSSIVPPPPPQIGFDNASVLAKTRKLIRRKRNSKSPQAKLDGDMIENFIAGEQIISAAEMQRVSALSMYSGDLGLQRVALILGSGLGEKIPWEAILNTRPQLSRTMYDTAAFAKAGAIYSAAQDNRTKWNQKKKNEKETALTQWKQRVDAHFLTGASK